jgi:Tfp pilus assembly protein PilF
LRSTALGFALAASLAHGAPHIPADDAVVLERLPASNTPAFRELKALRAAAARAPGDLAQATALATAYVRASRVEGDPRFLGYAESALAPWWKDPDAPTSVVLLRATIRQSRHEFDASVADLDRVLARNPRSAQALLTRATVLTVQGKYGPARDDCRRLEGLAPEIYPATCAAAIDGVTGKAKLAYDTLDARLAGAARVDAAGRAWAHTLQGELAARRGDPPAAEAHFRAALAADDKDLYLLGAYSDYLLDAGRPAEVIALLRNETRVDPLLLRLALAQKAARRPEAAASIATLAARFEASRARGDTVHQRENARFELFLRDDARAALPLARLNWNVQREPADVLLLAQVAAATGDAAALAEVRQWLAQTGFEYPAVTALLAGKAGRR